VHVHRELSAAARRGRTAVLVPFAFKAASESAIIAAYHDIVRICVMEPRCEAVTFWGFTDAHTWISGDSPLLFDAQYVPKPAYTGVLDALRGR
jgi:GH35 family endo-1,4-beta-xylanase